MDAAIEVGSEALAAIPADHPGRALALSNLGSALQARYRHRGDPADLEAAIGLLRQAVATTPADHPDRAARLSDLENALRNLDPQRLDVSELTAEAEGRYYVDRWSGLTEEAAQRAAEQAAARRAAEWAAMRDKARGRLTRWRVLVSARLTLVLAGLPRRRIPAAAEASTNQTCRRSVSWLRRCRRACRCRRR